MLFKNRKILFKIANQMASKLRSDIFGLGKKHANKEYNVYNIVINKKKNTVNYYLWKGK